MRLELRKKVEGVDTEMNKCKESQQQIQKGLRRLREEIMKEEERIDALEQHNNFTPQKMAKIHNMLDIEFSPSQEELLAKKNSDFGQNQVMK